MIEEHFCSRCNKITNHKELKRDYWECLNCHLRNIRRYEIKEEDLDLQEPSYYIFSDKEFFYFNDILSSNVFLKEDIKKLLKGEVLRVACYRNTK